MTSDLVGRPTTSFPSSRPDEGRRFAFSLYPDAESSTPITMPQRLVGHPGRSYIPYVGDLVNLGIANSPTIPKFLFNCQAVDFSTPIGQGASFTVTRLRVPKQGRLEYTTFSHDFTTTFSAKPSKTPEFVAYKTARVAFEPTGEPVESDQRAMFSALIELSALAHGPLAHHPNIVKLLGLAWGSSPFDPLHKLPILMVEYAQFGSLKELQESQALDSWTKLSLCLHVASGLEALHQCGIVHGDLKTENVLVFSDERGCYIAKLADFGFSIVEKSVNEMVCIGGTWPWKAPETNRPIERDHLKYTDVYSFGLMVWRVACDGMNPFQFITSEETPSSAPRDRIESLKQSGGLVRLCELGQWYQGYVNHSRSSNTSRSINHSVRRISTQSPFRDLIQLLWVRSLTMVEAILPWLSAHRDRSSPLNNAMKDPFYRVVEPVLKLTLQSNPSSRDLAEVIAVFRNGEGRGPMYE
ncbi:kinase-like domain-containing protein [Aspergillus cavernicola]|uniref:Kinase-like domain-containing protein n=1 Tax=Aspergillus cavernicola TaxID=176166 RepID=A0ABR4J198_9EURO